MQRLLPSRRLLVQISSHICCAHDLDSSLIIKKGMIDQFSPALACCQTQGNCLNTAYSSSACWVAAVQNFYKAMGWICLAVALIVGAIYGTAAAYMYS